MTGKQAFVAFNNWARANGYTQKVVGDNAWRDPRQPRRFVRLCSARNWVLTIWFSDTKQRIDIQMEVPS